MARFFFSRFFGPASAGGPGSAPATPTVAFSDNADGTGAVATVDGDGGATNDIYVQKFDETFGAGPWINAGTRSGDGDVALSLAVGHYLGYAQSTTSGGGAPSIVHYFTVTTGLESIHYRCIEAARTRIAAAGLSGLDGASVVAYHLPIARDFLAEPGETPLKTLPGVLVTPFGTERHDPDEGTNFRDVIEYPVQITIVAVQNQLLATNLEARLKWREQVFDAFRNQRLPGVEEVERCLIEPQSIVDTASFDNNLWHSAMVIYCRAKRRRGLGL